MCSLRPVIAILFLFAQPVALWPFSQPDSLMRALEAARADEEKLNILVELAAYYAMRGHESTLAVCLETVELSRKLETPSVEVRALLTLGLWRHNKGQYTEAQNHFFRALAIAESQQLPGQLPSIYLNLGLSYQRKYQQDSAYHFYLEAEQVFRQQGSPSEMWKVYNGLFGLFAEKGDPARASAYAHKAFDMVKENGSRAERGFLLVRLMQYFFRSGQFAEMDFFQDKWEEYQAEKRASRELMESPEHIELYLHGREASDSARLQLNRAIAYFDSTGNRYRAGWCYENLADFYLAQEQETQAERAFHAALLRYRQCGAGYRQGRVLHRLYLFNKAKGRFPEALQYLESYQLLADSLAGVEVEKNLDQLKVQYETEQKEQALALKSLELRQRSRERNVFLFSSILFAMLATIVFIGLRQRIAANRKLAKQESQLQEQRIRQLEQEKQLSALHAMIEGQEKERIRVANDLHDSLGGLFFSAKAHFMALDGQTRTTQNKSLFEQTAEIFDKAGVELRRISHNLMPRTLFLLGLQGAVEGLAGQLRTDGLQCRFQCIGLEKAIPEPTAVMLFRIIQELSNNILKHARASNVLIQLIQKDEEIHLILEDDGIGFDLETARQQQSLGLASIESRVSFLSGELDIDTAPGQGTTVVVRAPL